MIFEESGVKFQTKRRSASHDYGIFQKNLQGSDYLMSTPQFTPTLQFVWHTVKDVERALQFYGDTLGFPVQRTNDAFGIVQLGELALYLAAGEATPGNMYLAIAVPDIDAFSLYLQNQGVSAGAPVDEGWARYIELTDVDGYRLLILTPSAVL